MSEALKYVSAKTGHLMPRYGTQQNIGSRLVAAGEIVWLEKEVVALTEAEWNAHVKEYERAKRAGVVVERTKADHDAWLKLEQEREALELAERKKAEAEEAAKATTAAATPGTATVAPVVAAPSSVAVHTPADKFTSEEPATADEVTKGAKRAREEKR